MRKLTKRLAGLLFILLLPGYLLAQEKTITGKVTDGSGNPLPGANILIKLTNKGAIYQWSQT